MPKAFRNAALALAALVAAACAPLAPQGGAGTPAREAAAEVPMLDLGSKFAHGRRIKGKRARAANNALYQLETESDEQGPASAARFFAAHEQREALVRGAQALPEGGATAKAAGVMPSAWESIGPGNVAGRVRAIAFDPGNPARLLVGTASGGLWVSEDRAATWRAIHDFLPNLSITTVAFDPRDPRVVYLGTGEVSQLIVGVGAFKSVDGGRTWSLMPQTDFDANPDWRFVNRIAVHPTQTSIVLAGVAAENPVNGAIYRSADAGATWVRVAALKALDLAFEPANPDNVVAGLDDGTIAYSRDAGLTWARTAPLVASPSGRGNTARAEIAFAPSRPGLAYASVDNARGEVWRSLDSGATWHKTATPGHLAGQGEYDNAIWVDPLDPDHVIVGGLDLHQSFDGGLTFTRVSSSRLAPRSPHADHHAIVSPPDYGPANRVIYNGNDGGVYKAADVRAIEASGFGWTNANHGLNVTQFYSGAGLAAAGGRIIGGTQDNGSLRLADRAWSEWFGGDGGYVAVDPRGDQVLYGSVQYLGVFRSTDGGGRARFICTGISEAIQGEGAEAYCGSNNTQEVNFIAPLVMDPNNPERLLAGAYSLWVTDEARAPAPAWRVAMPRSTVARNYINAIAVQPGDSNVVWVGRNNGEVYRSGNALAATPAWARVGQGVLPARRVMRIMVDADNPARVLVAFTGFVPQNLWQTLDGGATWASVTGNLPAAPIFDVKRHPRNAQWLYVATSVGVFTSEDGGAHWSTTNEGPANVRVRELFWIDERTLGVATFGRGMFKATVPAGGPANYQDLWWAGAQENGWGMSITQHGATIFAALFVYDALGRPVWLVLPGGSWDAGFTTYSGALYAPAGSWFGAYDASRLQVGAPVGSASIAFTGRNSATLTYTINGVSGSKSITRQAFGPADSTPVAAYGDLWWGGTAQNGWGVAINQQYRTLFAVWYTYDAAGRTIWYVVPGGTWTAANVFTGAAYRTAGSPWLDAAYDPAAFATFPAGTVTFTFHDLNNATMSYSVEGVTQAKPIVRQPF